MQLVLFSPCDWAVGDRGMGRGEAGPLDLSPLCGTFAVADGFRKMSVFSSPSLPAPLSNLRVIKMCRLPNAPGVSNFLIEQGRLFQPRALKYLSTFSFTEINALSWWAIQLEVNVHFLKWSKVCVVFRPEMMTTPDCKLPVQSLRWKAAHTAFWSVSRNDPLEFMWAQDWSCLERK